VARNITFVVNKTSSTVQINIKKHSRFWAVYVNSDLLAVVVYKKGAHAVKDLIEKLSSYADKHPSS
jgi:hypothetical protein